jgi:hypothetical protein|tara:strand:+ start:1497 stop:1898 length:402 start_codon:yes stop_codon:yes gene_type:complete
MEKTNTNHLFIVLKLLAISLFAVYIIWNITYLSLGQLPPSILLSATGVPAPTTGLTRGLMAIGKGNITESLKLNPFSIPLIFLFVFSIFTIAYKLLKQQKLELPKILFSSWLVVLIAAWIFKLYALFFTDWPI